MDRCWQSFLRRFDLEHTFRLFKQVMGWTAPKLRDPAAADRWTWLIIAAHAQLRLARTLAEDLRLPWQRPAPAGRLTPARVRRGFRNIRAKAARPASAPKPGKPGPGRPPGSKNRHPATRHDVGKTAKRTTAKTKKPQADRLNNKLRARADKWVMTVAWLDGCPTGRWSMLERIRLRTVMIVSARSRKASTTSSRRP